MNYSVRNSEFLLCSTASSPPRKQQNLALECISKFLDTFSLKSSIGQIIKENFQWNKAGNKIRFSLRKHTSKEAYGVYSKDKCYTRNKENVITILSFRNSLRATLHLHAHWVVMAAFFNLEYLRRAKNLRQ